VGFTGWTRAVTVGRMRGRAGRWLIGPLALLALTLATGIASGGLGPRAVHKGRLRAADGQAMDGFGSSAAMSGRTLVVGAPGHGEAGTAYVFRRPRSGAWANAKQIAKLTPSDAVAGFGHALSMSGHVIVAGNEFDGDGSAYVFEKPADGWRSATEDAKLTPADTHAFSFGSSVGVSGRSILVGAIVSTVNGHAMQGSAYAFVRPDGGWADMNETARLYDGAGGENDLFGRSIAIEGDTAVVGAPGQNVAGNTPNRGAVYVFVAPSGPNTWADTGTPTAKLVGSEGAEGDFLGFAVDISGPTIVAGAIQDDFGSSMTQGSAYVFERPQSGWAEVIESTKLVASDGESGDRLGFSVGVSGKAIVLGTGTHDVGGAIDQGAAYLYRKPAGGWTSAASRTESKELVTADGKADDGFARSVTITSDAIAVGAPGDDVHGRDAQGSAYAFARPK
jgi:hypothetical protein